MKLYDVKNLFFKICIYDVVGIFVFVFKNKLISYIFIICLIFK